MQRDGSESSADRLLGEGIVVSAIEEDDKAMVEIEALGSYQGWRFIKADDNNDYYWNNETGESVWERPAVLDQYNITLVGEPPRGPTLTKV